MTRSRQTADWGSRAGLAKVIPSSVTVGSGTGSASTTGTVTYSGASSISLDNVFSSTYTSYKIVINNTSTSTNNYMTLKMRTSSDDSGTVYDVQRGRYGGGVGTTVEGTRGSNQTAANLTWDYTDKFSSELLIQNPNVASNTFISSLGQMESFSSTDIQITFVSIRVESTTQYTGFSLIASTGNFTGTVTVYGYN